MAPITYERLENIKCGDLRKGAIYARLDADKTGMESERNCLECAARVRCLHTAEGHKWVVEEAENCKISAK